MFDFIEKLKKDFLNLLKQKIVFSETKIILNGKIINTKKNPILANQILAKTSKIFKDFEEDVDKISLRMSQQMNDIFSELDKLK